MRREKKTKGVKNTRKHMKKVTSRVSRVSVYEKAWFTSMARF